MNTAWMLVFLTISYTHHTFSVQSAINPYPSWTEETCNEKKQDILFFNTDLNRHVLCLEIVYEPQPMGG